MTNCEKIQGILSDFIDSFHDAIIDISAENEKWYDLFDEETEKIAERINNMCKIEE